MSELFPKNYETSFKLLCHVLSDKGSHEVPARSSGNNIDWLNEDVFRENSFK